MDSVPGGLPGLPQAVKGVLNAAEGLKDEGAANEANTKHHVIEPVLRALGWAVDDFKEVDREYKVFDGTFLDYALRIEGKPKLFIEAKALGKALGDKAFIAQTVNYANNEGVVWCVLTNGLIYQAYKSNEPVVMEKKLLFEVDIREVADEQSRQRALASLADLSRTSVNSGELDRRGERVFADMRIRAALASMAANPPKGLVAAVASVMDDPKLDSARLRAGLSRLLEQLSGAQSAKPAPRLPKKNAHDLAHHTATKPAVIVDLFERVDAFARGLGDDVSRRPVKQYIGYYVGKKSFFTAELQKAKIWIYLSIPPSEAQPWTAEMQDATNKGHFGMGDTEFRLESVEQLQTLEQLIKQAYQRKRS